VARKTVRDKVPIIIIIQARRRWRRRKELAVAIDR